MTADDAADLDRSPRPSATYARRARPASRTGVVLAAVAFGAVLLLLVLRLSDQYGPADARARALGFSTTGDGVRITALIDRDPARDAVCLFRARNAAGAEVGHAEVRVAADPAGPSQVRVAAEVTTTGPPVTGETGRCLALPPGAALPGGEPVVLPDGD